jgi:hypothetical protein
MEIAEHIAALRWHGESLAGAADLAELGAPVPTKPLTPASWARTWSAWGVPRWV